MMIPKLAEKSFGPPASTLNDQDVFLYSVRLFLNQNKMETTTYLESDEVSFIINDGQPVITIVQNLEKAKLINSTEAFTDYLIYKGIDTQIQAGEYELSTSMNAYEIAEKLLDATPAEVQFVILPGWRIEEIGNILSTSGLTFTEDEFFEAVSNYPEASRPNLLYGIYDLEGFMFPDSYTFDRNINVYDFIQIILNHFSESITDDIKVGFQNQGLDIYDAIILASIVQREAMVSDEQPLIASVFINRINNGMKLESDPTVQYANGYDEENGTWWKNPLTYDDLNFQSPYNTYANSGLPPGAICNPGLSAIKAISQPEESNYFYFRSDCDNSGRHKFAETLPEHIANECSD